MTWIISASKSVKRKMPRQKPGVSEQVVGTPWDFIDAVEERFGALTLDLASDDTNAKAPVWITPEEDSLKVSWIKRICGPAWLNPEFGKIKHYVEKCARTANKFREEGDRILLLVPSSVGTHWYWNHVHDKALVLQLAPRLKFVGHKQHYPKDLMLCVYGEEPGFERWVWKEGTRARKKT